MAKPSVISYAHGNETITLNPPLAGILMSNPAEFNGIFNEINEISTVVCWLNACLAVPTRPWSDKLSFITCCNVIHSGNFRNDSNSFCTFQLLLHMRALLACAVEWVFSGWAS